MNKAQVLYLITFLVFPVLGYIASRRIEFERSKTFLKWAFVFFIIYDILFYFGYSLRGEYADYLVFSIEYLTFSFTVCLLYEPVNIYLAIFRTIGTIVLALGFTNAIASIAYLLPLTLIDLDATQIYNFTYESTRYETRQYNTGFATTLTYCSFETYKEYEYLPFERLINTSGFQEDESAINCFDNITVGIRKQRNVETLEFSSNGKTLYSTIVSY